VCSHDNFLYRYVDVSILLFSKLLREHLNELQLPCIPYLGNYFLWLDFGVFHLILGMYLTDLTFLTLSRKKNGSVSTPTTPVGKCPRLPITTAQGQVSYIKSELNVVIHLFRLILY